jgi:hypothetical protein
MDLLVIISVPSLHNWVMIASGPATSSGFIRLILGQGIRIYLHGWLFGGFHGSSHSMEKRCRTEYMLEDVALDLFDGVQFWLGAPAFGAENHSQGFIEILATSCPPLRPVLKIAKSDEV